MNTTSRLSVSQILFRRVAVGAMAGLTSGFIPLASTAFGQAAPAAEHRRPAARATPQRHPRRSQRLPLRQ